MQSKDPVEKTYKRPSWVKSGEEELCPECFKAVGDHNRYKLICLLGRAPEGLNVSEMTKNLELTQPTVTHHLNILKEVNAVTVLSEGRNRVYKINRKAHCFEDCQIPFK
ncbi:winged helix-turn-helix transcriptional regulator [Candidatus Nomurabacteria bacterium]|nr:winged helix-turn-helix transcriptional regulator [Candidatus Nomurabacteria bacterium]